MRYEKSCGAVLYTEENGELKVLVEHMRKGHVSIPKGHVEPGETESETALREIREETGLSAVLDTGFRRTVVYSPEPGVSKDVVFFTARALPGRLVCQECEVASAEFLPPAEAEAALTYDSDREVVRDACEYLSRAPGR